MSQLVTLTLQRLLTILSNWKTVAKYIILYTIVLIFCDRIMMTKVDTFGAPPANFKASRRHAGRRSKFKSNSHLNTNQRQMDQINLERHRGSKKGLFRGEGISHVRPASNRERILAGQGDSRPNVSPETINLDELGGILAEHENLKGEELDKIISSISFDVTKPMEQQIGLEQFERLSKIQKNRFQNVENQEELARQIKYLREMEHDLKSRCC